METDWFDGVIRKLNGFLTGSEHSRYVEAFLKVEDLNFEEKIVIKYKKAVELGLIVSSGWCYKCTKTVTELRCPSCGTSLETTADVPIGVFVKLKSEGGKPKVVDIRRKG